MGLQGQKNAACEMAIFSPIIGSYVWIGVWVSCQAIKWISVFVELCQVLANPVIYINPH